ncbi:hypothetical protein AGLY_000735 [Aphis glycines]|uniref:Uncharacterized protein n=1 Tax=Aphis glycines TaxID=307491 RepID=A0A6G0UA70_APHGL|nr:hypothetical protein AGLY_000735 [Aphis glycines]
MRACTHRERKTNDLVFETIIQICYGDQNICVRKHVLFVFVLLMYSVYGQQRLYPRKNVLYLYRWVCIRHPVAFDGRFERCVKQYTNPNMFITWEFKNTTVLRVNILKTVNNYKIISKSKVHMPLFGKYSNIPIMAHKNLLEKQKKNNLMSTVTSVRFKSILKYLIRLETFFMNKLETEQLTVSISKNIWIYLNKNKIKTTNDYHVKLNIKTFHDYMGIFDFILKYVGELFRIKRIMANIQPKLNCIVNNN